MRDWRVAGLVLSQVRARGGDARPLPDDVATVSVGGVGVADTFDGVAVSAGAVAKELARGLFDLGCRDLLAVGQGGFAHHSDDLVRHLASAWDAVARGSAPRLVRDILPPEPMLAAARLADRLDGMARPTGVLALDPIAEALVSSYALGRGIKVPDELPIVVCRPASRASEQPPRLVVVDYPADEIAAKAVDLLLLRIGEAGASPAVLEEPLRLARPLGRA